MCALSLRRTDEAAVQDGRGHRRPVELAAGGDQSGEEIVAVRVGWQESELQREVKAAGGEWDPAERVWRLRRKDWDWRGGSSRRLIDVEIYRCIELGGFIKVESGWGL